MGTATYSIVILVTNTDKNVSRNEEFVISPERNIKIGRSSKDVDIVIKSKAISRIHTLLKVVDGNIYLVDNESSNGTYLSGEKITKEEQLDLEQKFTISYFEFSILKFELSKHTVSNAEEDAEEDEEDAEEDEEEDEEDEEEEDKEETEWDALTDPRQFVSFTKNIIMLFLSKKQSFYTEIDLHGDLKQSAIAIVIFSLISYSISLLNVQIDFEISKLILTPLLGVIYFYGLAYFLEQTRGITKIQGTKEEYFRFFAYVAILGSFISLFSIIPVVGTVIAIVYLVWTAHSFFKVFRPKILLTIMTCVLYNVLYIILSTILFFDSEKTEKTQEKINTGQKENILRKSIREETN